MTSISFNPTSYQSSVLPKKSSRTSDSPLKRKIEEVVKNTQLTTSDSNKKSHLFTIPERTISLDIPLDLPPLLESYLQLIRSYLQANVKRSIPVTESWCKALFFVNNPAFSEEKKLAELGTLYFYLTAEKSIPTDDSLVKHRQDMLEADANELKSAHKKLGNKKLEKLFPSGYVTYLQYALAQMVFTSDGSFNLGGCYAVKELLNSRLSLLIYEELRVQILNVINCLITDESFRNLFKNPLTIHPDLVELITIDLKLSKGAVIDIVCVRLDLLIALFSIIGQTSEPNCYAVATDSNLLSEHFDAFLKILIEVLKTGTLCFESVEIPVLTLLKSRRKYERDFMEDIREDQAYNLTGISISCDLLGINTPSITSKVPLSLSALITKVFGEEAEYAKEIFLSHKRNLLQQMMLSIIQFIALNTSSIASIERNYSSCRKHLINKIKKLYIEEFKKKLQFHDIFSDADFQLFLKRFETAFSSTLFFIDCKSWKNQIVEGRSTFDFHSQGLVLEGNLSKYDLFMTTRCLFYLNKGNLEPIEKLSSLGNFLAECVEIARDPKDPPDFDVYINFLKFFFRTEFFRKKIAEIVNTLNIAKVQLSSDQYFKSDSFILIQNGGEGGLITIWEPLKDRWHVPSTITAEGPRSFFSQLCGKLYAYQSTHPEYFLRQDPQILISTSNHCFNLLPLHFKEFWEQPNDLMQQQIIAPGVSLLDKQLTNDEKKRVTLGLVEQQSIMKLVDQEGVNAKIFRDNVLSILDSRYHKPFKYNLERVLQEIPFCKIKCNIHAIMYKYGISLERKSLNEIYHFMDTKRKHKIFLTPFETAKYLRKALLSLKDPLIIPFYHLEHSIRQVFSLPQVVDVGNLNWVGQLSERNKYAHIICKFDFSQESVEFCSRQDGKEIPLRKDFIKSLFNSTKIYFAR